MLKVDLPPETKTYRHEAMATDFYAYLSGHDEEYLRQAAHEAFQLIDSLESKLSLYQESSDVSRVNLASPGDSVVVSAEFIDCLQNAAAASRMTQGKFDCFLGRAALLAKEQTLAHVSLDPLAGIEVDARLRVDAVNRRVERVDPTAVLDFGGIGKGYALDCMRESLQEWDVTCGILSSGGSTLLFLSPLPQFKNWRATIGTTPICIEENRSLSSSGLGFQENHIIDPATQMSGARWTRSYSVASTAAIADGLSTAALLATEPELERMAKANEDIAIVVEDESGKYQYFGDIEAGAKR